MLPKSLVCICLLHIFHLFHVIRETCSCNPQTLNRVFDVDCICALLTIQLSKSNIFVFTSKNKLSKSKTKSVFKTKKKTTNHFLKIDKHKNSNKHVIASCGRSRGPKSITLLIIAFRGAMFCLI